MPKSFLAAGLGYGIFLDSRVLSFSRACMRVLACACICVRARKAFLGGGGEYFSFSRERTGARARTHAKSFFAAFRGTF